jgi:cytochrome c peroxidase
VRGVWALVAPLACWIGGALAVPSAVGLLDFSAAERARIIAHGPWPPPRQADRSNAAEGRAAAVRFGRQLFSDPALSIDGRLACASCHVPGRAFQDGLPRSQGRTPALRNAPSLLDVAQQRWWGWGGSNDSLWAASLAPLLAPNEMARQPPELAAQVRRQPRWAQAYRAAFRQAPGPDDQRVVVDLAKALAAYQATLVSPRTPFDEFRDALLRGDLKTAARYPMTAQRGLRLFIGEARCTLCHAGPAFSNREFGDIGVPFFVPGGGVDSGRHGGIESLLASPYNRLGRFNDGGGADSRAVQTRQLLLQHRNFGEFRVPGLRQLVHTAPYMHDGSLATLEDVVRHYSALDEGRLHADGERILRRLNLTPAQSADLAAFLRSLSR